MFGIYASLKEIRQRMVFTWRTIRGIPFQYPLKQISKDFGCRRFCSWLNFVRVTFALQQIINGCTAKEVQEMFDIYANLKEVRQRMVFTGRTVKGVTFRYTLKQISQHFGCRKFGLGGTDLFDIYARRKERGHTRMGNSKSASMVKLPKVQTFYPSCKPFSEPMKLYIYVPP